MKQKISSTELVAVATAVHLYQQSCHDQESGILTIRRQSTDWCNRSLAMRDWPA